MQAARKDLLLLSSAWPIKKGSISYSQNWPRDERSKVEAKQIIIGGVYKPVNEQENKLI